MERAAYLVNKRAVPIRPGAPPGNYNLIVGIFCPDGRLPRMDEEGKVVGTTISLRPVGVKKSKSPPDIPSLSIQNPREDNLGDKITFLGYDRSRYTARHREAIFPVLYWQAKRDLKEDYKVLLRLRDELGRVRTLWEGHPVHDAYPTHLWEESEVVVDRYSLLIPPEIPEGEHELEMMVVDAISGNPLSTLEGVTTLSLGRLRVEAWERCFALPSIRYPARANLGRKVELLGYELDSDVVEPGGVLHLTLYWRALDEMETSYTVFTHLLDEGSRIWGQEDNPPVYGTCPTTFWVKGEVVRDEYEISVNPNAPSGEYVIEIRMYIAETGERLPVLDDKGEAVGDRVLLRKVRVR